MAAWFDEVRRAGLPRGDSIDLDFHAVPANTQEEPLEKHYLSSRSRSQQSVLVFLARDASARVLCYAHAGVAKDQKAAEVLRFADFWQERTGQPPAELVFDSQLTTYEQLHQLNQPRHQLPDAAAGRGRCWGGFGACPRRPGGASPAGALTRAFRTPRVLDERVTLPGYTGVLRQITVIDLGHEDPTLLLTNNTRARLRDPGDRCASGC